MTLFEAAVSINFSFAKSEKLTIIGTFACVELAKIVTIGQKFTTAHR